MSDMESLSRPWLPGDIRPSKKDTGREPVVAGNAVLTWGKGGGNVFLLAAGIQNNFVVEDDNVEIKRTFDTIRIKQPDNADNYVDVEVMTAYQSRNTISAERRKIAFSKVEASQNVEIIKRDQTRTSE